MVQVETIQSVVSCSFLAFDFNSLSTCRSDSDEWERCELGKSVGEGWAGLDTREGKNTVVTSRDSNSIVRGVRRIQGCGGARIPFVSDEQRKGSMGALMGAPGRAQTW